LVNQGPVKRLGIAAAWMVLLVGTVGRADEAAPPAPASTIPDGYAELHVDLGPGGTAVAVDSGHFCGVPCRMLLTPGEHTFELTHPDLDPRSFTRTFDAGRTLLLEGSLVGEELDTVGIVLYALGAIAILTATGLVAWDVAVNVGYGEGDWTRSYVAAGLGPVGLVLAIWGAARDDAGEGEITEAWAP
jgi:hypothetical protein